MVKTLLANAGDIRDTDSIPGWGRSPEAENGSPLQSIPMDRGAWQATVLRVSKSRTRLKQLTLPQNNTLDCGSALESTPG